MPIDDPVLRDDWHPVTRLADLDAGKPLGVRLLGEDVVVWQAGGTVLAVPSGKTPAVPENGCSVAYDLGLVP